MQNLNYNSIGVPQDEVFEHISIAKQCKYGIVELGILYGETTGRLCHANKTVHVYGIDPLIPDSMNPILVGNIQRIRDNTNGCGNFTFIKDYSYNVVTKWDKRFDYLFIDASHIYEDVLRDFEDWLPLLEPNGIVSLHDSACDRGGPHNWPGPSKLAKELFTDSRVQYIKTVYSLTIFMKNDNTI